MKKIDYLPEQIVNIYNIRYISEAAPIVDKNGKIVKRKGLFKCHCSKLFISTIADVTGNKRKSCGCRKGNKPVIYEEGVLINGIKFIKSCGTRRYAQRAIFECPVCKKEWESLIGNIQAGHTKSCCNIKRGWSKTQWKKLSENAYLYKVRLYNDSESFIKIGITTRALNKRFAKIPYNYEILKIIKGESGYIFDLENRCKRFFKKNNYKPLLNFKGYTECYNHYKQI